MADEWVKMLVWSSSIIIIIMMEQLLEFLVMAEQDLVLMILAD